MGRFFRREIWLLGTILALGVLIHAVSARDGIWIASDFLSPANLTTMAKQIALLGIFALGAGVIIVAGGIDLSSGSVICFTGIMCAKTPQWLAGAVDRWVASGTCPGFLANGLKAVGLTSAEEPYSALMLAIMVTATTAVGVAIGLFHGFLINRLDLPPFVATLGTMAGLRSLASVVTTGTIGMADERFRMIGRHWQAPVIIFLVEAVILAVILRSTRLGRYLYAMGGNEQAARLSGLDVPGLKRFAYVLGAATATLAGLVHLAHVGNASPQAGIGYELMAIAAAVVGGCNLKGGGGTILGVVLGVVLLRTVINGTLFVIEAQATEWEGFIVGVIVILAALLGKIGARS